MKKGVSLFGLLFMLSIGFCLATEVTIYNDSQVETDYTLGSEISGLLNFSLQNVPANSIISSNFGGNMTLREFLFLNGQTLPCEFFNCTDVYTVPSPTGSLSKTINYPSQNLFGFRIAGAGEVDIQIEKIKFNLTSNFPLSETIPLKLDLFSGVHWEFNEASADYKQKPNYGCFDSSATSSGLSGISTTRYCERIDSLPGSKRYKLGANLTGSGNTQMYMSLLRNGAEIETCDFNAESTSECILELTDFLESGEYLVCINAENDDKFYSFESENSGTNCGYKGDLSVTSGYDYPLFVQVPNFASSALFNLNQITAEEFADFRVAANNYLTDVYNKDCSTECILPVKISGINQQLEISSIKIDYSSRGREPYTDKVYSLSSTPLLVSYEGVVDLSKLGFILPSAGIKNLVISIDDEPILEKKVNIIVAPQILSLEPLNFPAGVPIVFKVNVSSNLNITDYSWNFGDGSATQVTTVNSVSHTYGNSSVYYDLQISVKDSSGSVSSKNFTILAGSPKEIINLTIAAKRIKLQNVADSLKSYPTWQSDYMKKLLKLEEYMAEVERLDKKRINIVSDSDLIKLAFELINLSIPERVFISSEMPSPFLIDAVNIDPTPLKKIGGGIGEDDLSEYKPSIAQWQMENIFGVMLTKRFEVLKDNNQISFLMNLYSVNLESSSSDESYFIANQGLDVLETDGSFDFKDSGKFSYLTIPANTKKMFTFISPSVEDLIVYISPVVSDLPYISEEIGVCNFNTVCEKDLKENYRNCRSDCKPVGRTIYWIFLILIFGLGIYTFLQVWYKNNYEKVLFEDRAHLFNLVSYVDNMTSRSTSEGEIRAKLAQQGWSSEKINYAFKKSKGQKAGMYELIPVEKLLSMLRQRESKKQVKTNPSLIPATPRSIMPQHTNLNKAQNPRQNIKRW